MSKYHLRPLVELLESRNLPGSILNPGLGILNLGPSDGITGTSAPGQLSVTSVSNPSLTDLGSASSVSLVSRPDVTQPYDAGTVYVATGGQVASQSTATGSSATSDPWQNGPLFAKTDATASSWRPAVLGQGPNGTAGGGGGGGTASAAAAVTSTGGVAASAPSLSGGGGATAGGRGVVSTAGSVASPAARATAPAQSQANATPAATSPLPVAAQSASSASGLATVGPNLPAGIVSPNGFSPYNLAPLNAKFDPVGVDPNPQGGQATALPLGPGPADDPGAMGPYDVTAQPYDLGSAAYVPPQFGTPTSANKIELTGEIYAPTDLSTLSNLPLVVLMHGNHVDEYSSTGGTGYQWPIGSGFTALPNYLGYGYFANVLASHGYVVVSVSANGVNVLGGGFAGTGMLGRGQLINRTLDIFSDLNTDGVVHTRPGDTTNFVDGTSPFGTRFVGKINMQDVGLMGHSRGGEGAVQGYLVNQAAGSPYGIKAVFAVAPVDFQSPTINNVNFAVLLPYNDGDVSDLEGAHFYDDSRYNVPGDTGAKFTIEVMGANHNFYNTVWSPGGGYPGGSDEGTGGPPTRLTQAQQRGTGLAYMSAFFRTYLGDDTQFLPIMTGDAPPPASAQVPAGNIHIGYLPPDDPTDRRDINRVLTAANLTTNTLGGAVTSGGGLAAPAFTTGGPSGSSEPHRSTGQVTLGYTGTTTAYWENDIPSGASDERAYADLQFRIGVNYGDTRNPTGMDQDFSVELDDGSGGAHSVLVSAYSNDLFDPPRNSTPHEVLNTVRIPLSAFVGFVDLSNITAVRFDFDQHASGAFQVTDLAFADPVPGAGPFVVSSSPSGNVFGPQSSVRVRFDRSIDPMTFTTASGVDSFTVTVGSMVTDLTTAITGVEAVTGSNNTQFDITFQSQTAAGTYQLTIGPNIQDLAGNPMDQDHDGVPGEPTDVYTASFTIQGPRIIIGTPTGNRFDPVSSVRVTFNEPVNPTTFGTGQITSFTRTVGTNTTDISSALAAVTPVNGSSNTQFDITFATQSELGMYSLVIGPGIVDAAGNPTTDSFTDTFTIKGPQVIASTPSGNTSLPGSVNSATVTFNEPMDPATFTPDKITAFTGPDGAHVVLSVTPVSGTSNTQFRITFDPLTATGSYTMTVGPDIRDLAGHPMDQNGNSIPGEPDDAFALQFGVAGLKVNSTLITSPLVPGQVYKFRVTFNESVDVSRLAADQISIVGPDGDHPVVGVAPVPGSNYTQFDVLFAPLTAAGAYQLSIGPTIYDVYGNAMDQDGDLIPGESTDVYTRSGTIAGPSLVSIAPVGMVQPPVDHVRVTFSEPMNPASFDPSQVSLTDPSGAAVPVTSVSAAPFTDDTQLDFNFDAQGLAGTYNITVSGGADAYGNPLSAPGTGSFSIAGPLVLSFSPSGNVTGPVDHVRVTFNRPMNASTFTTDQVTLLDAGGNPVTIASVVDVPGSNHTQFDVNFDPQSTHGNYALTLSNGILDTYGNPVTGSSMLTNLVTNGGFETGTLSGWTATGLTQVTTNPHSGQYDCEFGQSGSLGTLTQTLTTIAGQQYTLTYWLAHNQSGAGSPNEFRVTVGGATLYDQTDLGIFDYTPFSFTFTATGASTVLQFAGREDPSYFDLDDVSVVQAGGTLTDHFTIT
jgi:hypothetical protein